MSKLRVDRSLEIEHMDILNQHMFAIAERAKELGQLKMDELRLAAGFNCDTEAEARSMNRHETRGKLIEAILVEEYYIDLQ